MRTVAFPCRGFVISQRQMTCQRAYLYADPRKGRGCADDMTVSVDVSWMERGGASGGASECSSSGASGGPCVGT